MPILRIIAVVTATILLARTVAQSPPRPQDTIKLNSTVLPGGQVQYKGVQICRSGKNARSFSGYVHLPVDSLRYVGLDQHLPINTFFWCFESQTNPENAPLTVYLEGGPGPTVMSLLRGIGPCRINVDGRTTRSNPWSWNLDSNILFIDQPVNTGMAHASEGSKGADFNEGFSYDVPTMATVNFRGQVSLQKNEPEIDISDSRLVKLGRFGTGLADKDTIFNGTEAAVRALWLSLSIWLEDFPESQFDDHNIGLWAASYGGHYATALYDFTMSQNKALEAGKCALDGAPSIHFVSMGFTNGCIDALAQLPAYPEMAFNNTYGLPLINQSTYVSARMFWDSIDGCKERIQSCRRASARLSNIGSNSSINALCHKANTFCGKHMVNLISSKGRDAFDIGHTSRFLTEPTLQTHLAYLKQADVQADLGVFVNFTDNAMNIATAFTGTGDNIRGDYQASLIRALDDGVRITLMYGDRDYACNWLGGEALSLSLQHKHVHSFQNAGYQPVQFPKGQERSDKTPEAYVRQYGNLAFVRVLNSSHTISTEWPSVGFTIFNRAIKGKDIASGKIDVSGIPTYATTGPNSTMHIQNQLPEDAHEEEGMCYTLALSFCSERQLNAYLNGLGTVKDYWLMDYGHGICSPNPIEPCQINPVKVNVAGFRGKSGNLIEISSEYTVYCVLVIVIVIVMVRNHTLRLATLLRHRYSALDIQYNE